MPEAGGPLLLLPSGWPQGSKGPTAAPRGSGPCRLEELCPLARGSCLQQNQPEWQGEQQSKGPGVRRELGFTRCQAALSCCSQNDHTFSNECTFQPQVHVGRAHTRKAGSVLEPRTQWTKPRPLSLCLSADSVPETLIFPSCTKAGATPAGTRARRALERRHKRGSSVQVLH